MLCSSPLRISRTESMRRNEYYLAPLHAALRLLLFRSLLSYSISFLLNPFQHILVGFEYLIERGDGHPSYNIIGLQSIQEEISIFCVVFFCPMRYIYLFPIINYYFFGLKKAVYLQRLSTEIALPAIRHRI